MTAPVLEIHALRKSYGRAPVLRGVELTLRPGEHLGLIGNNGQGKTTLLRLILGLVRPDGGTLSLEGRPVGVHRSPAEKRAFGYLPEAVAFYDALSGAATLRHLARLKGAAAAEVAPLLELVGLAGAADVPVRAYSKGMRQRLGLAQALLGSPRLLLLDEPTSGLDPQGIHEFYEILQRLRERGVAVLMASHLLSEIEPRLDRLAVLQDGVVRHAGTVAELTGASRLPTVIRFTLRPGADGLPSALAELPVRPNGAAGRYQAQCTGTETWRVLDVLMRHRERLAALDVREPGLEEVFHHLHAAPAGAAAAPAAEVRP